MYKSKLVLQGHVLKYNHSLSCESAKADIIYGSHEILVLANPLTYSKPCHTLKTKY